MESQRLYRATKTLRLSRVIEAKSAEEARRMAEDIGEEGADTYSSEWQVKLIRK